MTSDFLHRIARERAADARGARCRRPVAALLRYAVLGAVALSILPASAAASLPTHAQAKSGARADSEPQRAPERPSQGPAFERDYGGVQRPPRVNTQPFKDLLLKAKRLYDAGQLDLSRTIELNAEADRADDGTLTNFQMSSLTRDSAHRELAIGVVAAISQSRLLRFLEGVPHIRLKLFLDQQRLAITSSAEVASEDLARQMSSGYGGLLAFARVRERGRPSGVVWNSMGFKSDGKQFTVTLEMSREEAGRLLLQLITPN
jgi:hypothetical protein